MQTQNSSAYLRRLRVSGADAESFLQGQLTQDIRAITAQKPLWAGYCSPKGRLLAVAQLFKGDGYFDLEMHQGVFEATAKRLKMFVLRAKVALDTVDAPIFMDETDWRRQNILQGIPVIYPETSDHFVPQTVNLDLLGGISFSKGCYTGQEIVARLHYLGNLKRRMQLWRGSGAVPQAGHTVLPENEAQEVGEIVDAVADGKDFAAGIVVHLGYSGSKHLKLRDSSISLQDGQDYSYVSP